MTSPLPAEPTEEQIYEELQKLVELGGLEYVVPTDPLGEEWVLGYKGQIFKLKGKGEAVAFLMGSTVVTMLLYDRTGRRP